MIYNRDLGGPFELQQGSQASFRVAEGNFGFLLICNRELRIPLGSSPVWVGTRGSFRLVVGPLLRLSWSDLSLAEMCRVASDLLLCWVATH